MKEIRVLAVCGMGFGTSLMMFMNAQEIGKKYGVKISGEAIDLGSYKGKNADVIIASKDLSTMIDPGNTPLIKIDNIIDKEELERKIKQYF